MSEHQRHAIPELAVLDQLYDDPVIATHLAYKMLQASENFNFNFVSRELEADPF
ncbi:hypothetical protein BPNPMPFG_003644 [Mesorhizobium sp. AR07]|uniref:hypothetical protein n=1 Tax=Mesorhizobium sp. AR07 TaxID=2865838 RepID=UPI00215E33B9|nr:hypothetical protein [Mesorhizobium sp. AR07]UVK42011.1 hypothetical protein BPNPMPFG_003644 [Mesorhizobium sp. AR07]